MPAPQVTPTDGTATLEDLNADLTTLWNRMSSGISTDDFDAIDESGGYHGLDATGAPVSGEYVAVWHIEEDRAYQFAISRVVGGAYPARSWYRFRTATTWDDWQEITTPRSVKEMTGVTWGEGLGIAAPSRNLANGATATSGTDWGITVPGGETGANSFVQANMPFDGSKYVGKTIRLRFSVEVSFGFSLPMSLVLQIEDSAGSSETRSATVRRFIPDGHIVFECDYVVQGDEAKLRPFVRLDGGSSVPSVSTFAVVSVRPMIVDEDGHITNNDLNVDERLAQDKFTGPNIMGSEGFSFRFYELGGGVAFGNWAGKIPSGQTGDTAIWQPELVVDGSALNGREIYGQMVFEKSDGFSRNLNDLIFQVATAGGNVNRTGDTFVSQVETNDLLVIKFRYVFEGDEIILRPYFSTSGNSATSGDEVLSLTAFRYHLDPIEGQDINQIALDMHVARSAEVSHNYSAIPAATARQSLTVAPSGGDFTSPKAARDFVTDATALNRVKITVEPGVYEDPEWFDKDFLDFVGTSKEECHIKFHQPNNATGLEMASDSAIFMRHTSRLEGLKITAKNARYGVHLESDGNYPNRAQEIVNCYIEHLGNDDAPANYWGAQYAIGSGVSSGQVIRIEDTTLISRRRGGFSYHTNVDFKDPSRVELIRSRLVARQAGQNSFEMKPLGSFQPDVCHAEGCVFAGDIAMIVDPWLQTDVSKQPADHNEITLTGHGNSPAVFRNYDWGEALRIDSNTTGTSSSVVIAGNAVKDIFGDTLTDRYFQRAGSAGFSAAVWGWGDISTQQVGLSKNVLNKTLGQRLGDCSSTSKTLTVTIDGGSPITVTFDQNHTAQDNATVLGIINAALGSDGTASIYMPGARKRPIFADEEIALKNTSGAGVVAGTVMAFDGSYLQARPMTSADAPELFAGVVWGEDIAANDVGRIKNKGWVHRSDVLGGAALATTFGNTFSIDASNPGQIVAGGSQGLLMAVGNQGMKVG